jgi:predicted dehydrogenase
VATEPAAHAELIELGLTSGIPVVCEKPLAHTEADRAAVEAAIIKSHGLAVVTVLQYRYSRTWAHLAPAMRRANGLRLPFSMAVEVCRDGMEDPYAGSGWRADLEGSGGMLADHGPHYLALARTIDSDISFRAAERFWDGSGRERSRAELKVGFGRLELRLSTLAEARQTRIAALAPGIAVEWERGRATLLLAGREAASWPADELSGRAFLDSLYVPFYEDIVRNLADPDWGAQRTAESLGISGLVVEMLERVVDLDSISA